MTYFCQHGQRHECVSQPRVSPKVPYDFKSVLSTNKAHRVVASRVTHVSSYHSQGTQAYLVAV
ncbi:hypothetical protein F383_35378 [Gossypium arboreum]|uniref:Uncharacterized protein n=1 Tax=Gossypium arboreum TaxID=29729 RepID=A0A0B0N814_GOSAR|nr:hypothetical protein F383_35378 [Gossypium arboreum]